MSNEKFNPTNLSDEEHDRNIDDRKKIILSYLIDPTKQGTVKDFAADKPREFADLLKAFRETRKDVIRRLNALKRRK